MLSITNQCDVIQRVVMQSAKFFKIYVYNSCALPHPAA